VVNDSKPPIGCAEERSASFRSSQNFTTDTSKPAGRAPPGALLFVSRQKVSKKRLPLQGALLSRGAVKANLRCVVKVRRRFLRGSLLLWMFRGGKNKSFPPSEGGRCFVG
jgi:hypothetical protein